MKMKDVAPCEFFANSSIVTFEGQTVVRIDPGPTSGSADGCARRCGRTAADNTAEDDPLKVSMHGGIQNKPLHASYWHLPFRGLSLNVVVIL